MRSADNARKLSKIGVNSTRTFEQTSRDAAATRMGRDDMSNTASVYVERHPEEQRDQRRI